jgi:hypothetical protein
MARVVAEVDKHDYNAGLDVLIAYDHLIARQRAMLTFSHLARDLGDEMEMRLRWWRFDMLESPGWRNSTMNDAVDADLLVISASRKETLPVSLQDWLREWVSRKRGDNAAVVALLGQDNEDSPRLQFVRRAATDAGLAFFAPLPERQLSTGCTFDRIHRQGQKSLSHISPYAHWGLNE